MAIVASGRKVLSEEEILRIVPTLPYRSSWELYWPGVEVHRFRLPPGETSDHSYPQLAVFLQQSPEPATLELMIGGVAIARTVDMNAATIMPARLLHSGKCDTPRDLTAIFLDPALTHEVALALTGVEEPEIELKMGICDPVVRALGDSLDAELFASRPSPRIYIESLAVALGAHIIASYAKPVFTGGDLSALSGTQLRRSIEFMKDNLERDVTLEDLAAAAAMSKYHYAKSFKHALGVAPHQYLVRLRIEKARRMLASDGLSIEEIANRVGYSDRAHFAEQFRKCTGVSPSRYRRLK